MTDTKPTESQCGTWQRRPERGQAIIEFSLCFLLFLSIMIAIFNFGWLLFTKATLNQAVQAGVRFAITGPDGGAAGQDAIIKDVVKEHSIGLINDSNLDQLHIEYFRPNCLDDPGTPVNECATTANSARNIIAIRISDYEVPFVASILMGVLANGATFSVTAMDKVEPFPGATPGRDPEP